MKQNLPFVFLLAMMGAGFLLVSHPNLQSLSLALLSFAVLSFPLLALFIQPRRKQRNSEQEIEIGI